MIKASWSERRQNMGKFCAFSQIFLTLKFIKKISQATRNNKLHKKVLNIVNFMQMRKKLQIFTQKKENSFIEVECSLIVKT